MLKIEEKICRKKEAPFNFIIFVTFHVRFKNIFAFMTIFITFKV